MLYLTLALLLSQPMPLSTADRAAQGALRRAVSQRENEAISRRQFERLAPRRNIPTWQRLQRRIRYPQRGALDLAFVLAYYGVDYRQNLQQLMRPARLWLKDKAPMPEYLAQDLAILHEKHRDTASLAALLDLVLDGHPGEEQEAIVYDLWQREARTMLRLAAGSKTRLRTLEDMVLMEGDDLEARKELFAELRRLGRHHDRRVAAAAQSLLAMSKRDFAQEGE
jgi:hypothetical protein